MKLFSRKMLFPIIIGLIAITSYQNCAPQRTFTSSNEGINASEQNSTNPLSLTTKGTTNKVKDGKFPESDAGFSYIGIYQLKNRENNKCLGWSSVDSYYSTFDCSETFTEYMVYQFQDGTYTLCNNGTLKYYENKQSFYNAHTAYCFRVGGFGPGTVQTPGPPEVCTLSVRS